jgi:hypothetical protein
MEPEMYTVVLKDASLVLTTDGEFAESDIVVSEKSDRIVLNAHKAGIRTIEASQEKIDLRLAEDALTTIETIDGRGTTELFEVEISGVHDTSGMRRTIYGGAGSNKVMSFGDGATVTYHGGDGADKLRLHEGVWTILPGKGQNLIQVATANVVTHTIIERPGDSVMGYGDTLASNSMTIIAHLKTADHGVFGSNILDKIIFGSGFAGQSLHIVNDQVQAKIDELVKREGEKHCSEIRDKVMELEQIREGDIVRITCVSPDTDIIAVKNPEKTVIGIEVLPLQGKLSAENLAWTDETPYVIAAGPVGTEQSQLVGQVVQSASSADMAGLPS